MSKEFDEWWKTLHRPFSGAKKGYKKGAIDGFIAGQKAITDRRCDTCYYGTINASCSLCYRQASCDLIDAWQPIENTNKIKGN